MAKYRFTGRIILVSLILLGLLQVQIPPVITSSSTGSFTYLYTIFTSSTGGDVYPGSTGASLRIGVQYNGTSNATNIYACIHLPQEFTPRQNCSMAYGLDNKPSGPVSPGMIIEFHYTIDVSGNTAPATYTGYINITYTYTGNTTINSQAIYFNTTIKPVPEPRLRIVDDYWSPAGYPGSNNVDLLVILENDGGSTLVNGEAKLVLPEGFEPTIIRTGINTLAPNSRATITYTGVSIEPQLSPGNYTAILEINALYSTSDGVRYNRSITMEINVTVEQPPPINIEVVDHGLTSTNPYVGTMYSRIYVEIQSLDDAVIETGLALVKLLNGLFANGSSTALIDVGGPVRYGDVFTVETPRFTPQPNSTTIIYKITLKLLMNDNGVEYWNTTTYILYTNLEEPSIGLYISDTYWGSGRIYPGSSGETLHIHILNTMETDARSIYASLILPGSVFVEEIIHSGPYIIGSGSITDLSFNGIDIKPMARPGSYPVRLILEGILDNNDGSWLNFTINYTVILQISDPSIKPLSHVIHEWDGMRPVLGAHGLSLRILLNLTIASRIISGTATLIMPPGIVDGSTGYHNETVQLPSMSYGEIGSIVFDNIDVSTATDNPAVFAVKYTYLLSINGAETWINQTILLTQYFTEPRLNISLIDTGWTTRIAGNESVGLGLYVSIQSLSRDRVELIVANLTPIGNAWFGHGHRYSIVIHNTPMDYASITTLRFPDLAVNTSSDHLSFKLIINAVLRTRSAYYNASKTIVFTLGFNTSSRQLILYNQWVSVNGNPAVILPNADGLTLHITLQNTWTEAVMVLRGEIKAPTGFHFNKPADTCSGIGGGGTCSLTYVFSTDSLEPGKYSAVLRLTYTLDTGGSLQYYHEKIPVRLVVGDPAEYRPRLEVISKYWGEGRPTYIYPGDSYAPLTITIHNSGRYPAHNPVVSLKPTDSTIRVLDSNKTCGSIGSTDTCTLTYHIDLRNTGPGLKSFSLVIEYYVVMYGSLNSYTETMNIVVGLPSPETMINGEGLMVVDMGWLNNWPVHPGDNNTVYVVSIANLYPHTLESIYAVLEPPAGIRESGPGSLESYAAGPVASLQTFTVSYTMDISRSMEPGTYTGRLRLTYYIATDGSGKRVTAELPLVFEIDGTGNIVMIYQYGWMGSGPSLDSHYSRYYVMLRNNKEASMKGLILTVHLPGGVYGAVNQSSWISTAPSAIIPSAALQAFSTGGGLSPQQLADLLGGRSQIPINPSLGVGDLVSFSIPLSLNLTRPGVYYMNATLDYIDQWGSRQGIILRISLVVYGKPPILNITLTNTTIVIRGGRGVVGLILTNPYDSAIYNVYLTLLPASPTLIPEDNVRYYSVIGPHASVRALFNVSYSPVEAPSMFAETVANSWNGVFRVGVIYRDSVGGLSLYNTTLTAIVRPFIDVRLSPDTTATYGDGVLRISGILINYGITTAHSVGVSALIGGRSGSAFIGDMDPASQSAFRIDIGGVKPRSGDKVVVIVEYRDDYNTLYTRSYTVSIGIQEAEATTTTPPSSGGDYHMVVVAVVGAFLAGVFYVIYRMAKVHERRLGA